MDECPRPLDFVDPMTFRGGPITAAQRKAELRKRGLLDMIKVINAFLDFVIQGLLRKVERKELWKRMLKQQLLNHKKNEEERQIFLLLINGT